MNRNVILPMKPQAWTIERSMIRSFSAIVSGGEKLPSPSMISLKKMTFQEK